MGIQDDHRDFQHGLKGGSPLTANNAIAWAAGDAQRKLEATGTRYPYGRRTSKRVADLYPCRRCGRSDWSPSRLQARSRAYQCLVVAGWRHLAGRDNCSLLWAQGSAGMVERNHHGRRIGCGCRRDRMDPTQPTVVHRSCDRRWRRHVLRFQFA